MRAGDLLPTEKEMSDRLGVSRTVIREAFRGLETLGFVEVRHGKGRFLNQFSLETLVDNLSCGLEITVRDFRHVLEVRMRLEESFLLACVPTYDTADLAGFRAGLGKLRKVAESKPAALEEELLQVHNEWHTSLYLKTDNPLLLDLIGVFTALQRNLMRFHEYMFCDRSRFVKDHETLLNAIESRDTALVGSTLRSHFTEVEDWIRMKEEKEKRRN